MDGSRRDRTVANVSTIRRRAYSGATLRSMVAYMDYLERRAVRYVQPFGGFGDWLAIEPTNSMLTNTAYSAYDALIMEQVAKRLGKDADQRRFRTFYENVKRSFNDLFVNEEGRTFAPTVESIFGKDSQVGMWPGTAATEAKIVDTQTSYVVPLQFDLFNEKKQTLGDPASGREYQET